MKIGVIQPAQYDFGGGHVYAEEVAAALNGEVLWMQTPKFSSKPHVVLPKSDDEAVAVLRAHEKVLLPVARFPRGHLTERLLRLLRASGVPWTFVQQDAIVDKQMPYHELLSLPGYTGRAVTTVREYGAAFDKAYGTSLKWLVTPHLPYTPCCQGPPPMPTTHTLVSTSRTEFTKGIGPLTYIANLLCINVVLGGRSVPNRAGYASGTLAENLRDLGWAFVPHDWQIGKYKPGPWQALSPNGGSVEYLSGYKSAFYVLRDARAHVNLASNRRAFGHLEYVTLEAMDAGVPSVIPQHQDPRHEYERLFCVQDYRTAGQCNLEDLAEKIGAALTCENREEICQSMRSDLIWIHNPTAYGRMLLKGAF